MRRLPIVLLVLASGTCMLAACGELDDPPGGDGDGGAGGEMNGSGGSIGGAGGESPSEFVPGFFNVPGVLPVDIPAVVRTAGYASDSPELRVMDAFSTVGEVFNTKFVDCGLADAGIDNDEIDRSYNAFCQKACMAAYATCDDANTYVCDGVVTSASASTNELGDCLDSCSAFSCDDGSGSNPGVCDLTVDCDDASDESDCGDFVFLCASADEAVSGSARCDGLDDCADGSDEVGCGQEGFVCADGKTRIATIEQCDGYEDCDGGSDEVGCDDLLFNCGDTSYPWYFACDGQQNCFPDSEDEMGCFVIDDLAATCP